MRAIYNPLGTSYTFQFHAWLLRARAYAHNMHRHGVTGTSTVDLHKSPRERYGQLKVGGFYAVNTVSIGQFGSGEHESSIKMIAGRRLVVLLIRGK